MELNMKDLEIKKKLLVKFAQKKLTHYEIEVMNELIDKSTAFFSIDQKIEHNEQILKLKRLSNEKMLKFRELYKNEMEKERSVQEKYKEEINSKIEKVIIF